MLAYFERYCKRQDFKTRAHQVKSKLELFPIIKEYYSFVHDDLMKARASGYIWYPYDLPIFNYATPIEIELWEMLRANGLPFVMEYPVLNYFIDFADPYMKVGIEADGKEWHNKEKDKIRDAELKKIGWKIFRIEGCKLMRNIPDGYSDEEIGSEWDEMEYEVRESYASFSDFKRQKMDDNLDYSNKFAGAIIEDIARTFYNKKINCYG